jgi:hypothetical protein
VNEKAPRQQCRRGSEGNKGCRMDSPCEPAWTYFSVRAAQVEPQVGVIPMRTAVIGQAVQFVAIPCGVGLHASALLALAVEAMCVIKQRLCHRDVRNCSDLT